MKGQPEPGHSAEHPDEILDRCDKLHSEVLQAVRVADDDGRGLTPDQIPKECPTDEGAVDVAAVECRLNDLIKLGRVERLKGGRIGLITLDPTIEINPPGGPPA